FCLMFFCLSISSCSHFFSLFFFHHPSTTKIYTLSLHDALPIYQRSVRGRWTSPGPTIGAAASRTGPLRCAVAALAFRAAISPRPDRKSTRLNSSHLVISYAVFCLKKKTNINNL